MCTVERGSSSDQTIKIVRKTLHLRRCFTAALRAAGEICETRINTIECVNDRPRVLGRLVHSVDPPVQNLVSVEEEPWDITGCSVVRARRRVVLPEGDHHPRIDDRTRKATIAYLLEFVVPAGQRHPHPEPDVRGGSGLRYAHHPAESG